MVLTELIFHSSTLGGCGGPEELILNSFYFWSMCCSCKNWFLTVSTLECWGEGISEFMSMAPTLVPILTIRYLWGGRYVWHKCKKDIWKFAHTLQVCILLLWGLFYKRPTSLLEHFFPLKIVIFMFLSGGVKQTAKNFTFCWFWLRKMHQNGLSSTYLGFQVHWIQWHRFQVSMISGSWKIKILGDK